MNTQASPARASGELRAAAEQGGEHGHRAPVVLPPGSDLPPPCPGVRHVRVGRFGIIVADDDLRRRLDRFFHYPMIVLALLTLPLLVIDYWYIQEGGESGPTSNWLWWLTIVGLTVIWLAFLIEFIVKIAIAECRVEYIKRNWLDLIIIVVPLLRPLRAAALARTASVFTLRGVGFKFCRYVFTIIVGLEATERMLHRMGWKKPAGRREPQVMTRYELMDEVKRLRQRSDQWESWHKAEQEFLAQHGSRAYDEPCPTDRGDQSAVNR